MGHGESNGFLKGYDSKGGDEEQQQERVLGVAKTVEGPRGGATTDLGPGMACHGSMELGKGLEMSGEGAEAKRREDEKCL